MRLNTSVWSSRQRSTDKMGCASSKCGSPGRIEVSHKTASKGLPPAFHLTSSRSKDKLIFHASAPRFDPLCAVGTPEVWGGQTVLYSVQGRKLKPMAHAVRRKQDFTIHLPGVPSAGIIACEATMRRSSQSERYSFTMMVGHLGRIHSYRNEAFEWRRMGAKEASRLGVAGPGWKLVRLGPGARDDKLPRYESDKERPSGNGTLLAHQGRAASSEKGDWGDMDPTSSHDENTLAGQGEVVALLAADGEGLINAHFEFRGSGLTPEIGYHWALTAVTTGLCICQHQAAKELDGF